MKPTEETCQMAALRKAVKLTIRRRQVFAALKFAKARQQWRKSEDDR